MSCDACKSERVIDVNGKTSDCCFIQFSDIGKDGYVPKDMGIGGGDYLDFALCLNCGKLQGEFPLPLSELEKTEE